MKTGFRTSEFWVIIIMATLTAVNKLFGLGISDDILQNLALMIAAYIVGRSGVKAVEVKNNKKK